MRVIKGCAGQMFVQTVLEIVCLCFWLCDRVFFFKVEGGKSRDFRCVWNEAWVYKEGFFFEARVFKGWLFFFFLRHGFFLCETRREFGRCDYMQQGRREKNILTVMSVKISLHIDFKRGKKHVDEYILI